MKINRSILGIIIAIASLASIGIFIHKSEVGPIITGFYRCLFAIPLLLIAEQFSKKNDSTIPAKVSHKSLFVLNSIAGIALAMDICVWNLSFKYTTMAEANLIVNLAPFLILPLTIFYFKEPVNKLVTYPIIAAILGLFLLVFSGKSTANIHMMGDLLAFIAAIFYAIFVVVTKISADKGANMTRYMTIISLYCALILLVSGIIAQEKILPDSLNGWLLLLGLAFISQILGQLMLARSIKKVKLQISSILLLMQPVFAAAYGFIFFNENLTLLQIIGALIILISVYVFKRVEAIPRKFKP